MGSFHCSDDVVEDVCVIHAAGYLDFEVAPQLKRCIVRRIDAGHRELVVDLAEAGFIDSTAIGVLVGAFKRLRDENGRMAVVCGDDNVRGIFEIAGVEHVIPLYGSREGAMAAVAHVA